MYKIIEFDNEEGSAEIVPASWCYTQDDDIFTFWPPWKDTRKIISAIVLRGVPDPQWGRYRIARIIAEAGEFNSFVRNYNVISFIPL